MSLKKGLSYKEIMKSILVTTFTNAAVDVLLDKINKELTKIIINGIELKELKKSDVFYIGTIHSICYNELKKIKENIKIFSGEDEEMFTYLYPRYKHAFSINSRSYISLYNLEAFNKEFFNKKIKEYGGEKEYQDFKSIYEDFKTTKNIVDFTDMVIMFLKYCQPLENIKLAISDESNDLSPGLGDAFNHLTSNMKNGEIIILADANQNVLEFSGSNLSYIRDYKKKYPDTIIEYLNFSFRLNPNTISQVSYLKDRIPNRTEIDILPKKNNKRLSYKNIFVWNFNSIKDDILKTIEKNSEKENHIFFLCRNKKFFYLPKKNLMRLGLSFTIYNNNGVERYPDQLLLERKSLGLDERSYMRKINSQGQINDFDTIKNHDIY